MIHNVIHHPEYDRSSFHEDPRNRTIARLFWRIVNYVNQVGVRQIEPIIEEDNIDDSGAGFADEISSMMSTPDVIDVNGRMEWTARNEDTDDSDFSDGEGGDVAVMRRRRRRARHIALKQAYLNMDEAMAREPFGGNGGLLSGGDEGNGQQQQLERSFAHTYDENQDEIDEDLVLRRIAFERTWRYMILRYNRRCEGEEIPEDIRVS